MSSTFCIIFLRFFGSFPQAKKQLRAGRIDAQCNKRMVGSTWCEAEKDGARYGSRGAQSGVGGLECWGAKYISLFKKNNKKWGFCCKKYNIANDATSRGKNE